MARTTPQVAHNLLTSGDSVTPIVVGSPAWFSWLEQASRFAFRSAAGSFTARREERVRGGGYWRAYRTVDGRQRRAYLGRSIDLTPEQLQAVAAQLAADASASESSAPDPASEQRARSAARSATPLLSTKLYIPRLRSALVARPRLLARLDAAIGVPLTLIAAPAGFGKTTLLAEWLAQLKIENEKLRKPTNSDNFQFSIVHFQFNVAWLALDSSDNDPNIFLRYLIAALRQAEPMAGAAALALMDESQPPAPSALLTSLINDLAAAPQPVLLVLDDYHVITSPAVHAAMTFLLDHLPPTLRLAIGSREDPPLPLARLRARGQIAELRAIDLRFTPDEAAAFLHDVMQLDISEEDVLALEARTEGWVAGLQLAALAMQNHADRAGFIDAFTGSNRFVIDYLASEVLDRLPDHTRSFMLQTAILDRLCGPLCDFVTEIENAQLKIEKSSVEAQPSQFFIFNSQFLLEDLERANLFLVALDEQRRWYRYHQLFAGVLRERLQRSESAAEIAQLHQRASVWFEQNKLTDAAIHHALAACDFARAADLIERDAIALTLAGRQATVSSWLAELPDDLRRARPRLALAQASVAGSNGDFAAAAALLQQAEAAADAWPAQAAAVRAEVAAFRTLALSMLGDPRAIELGRSALAQLPAQHPLREITTAGLGYAAFYAGDLPTTSRILEQALATQHAEHSPIATHAGLLAMLAMVRRAQGRLREVRRLSEEVLRRTTHASRILPLTGAFLAMLLLGLTQCEQNELDAAEHTLRDCVALAGQYQVAMYEVLGQFYLGQVLAARGDHVGALALVEQAAAAAGRYLSPRNQREIVSYRVLLWLRMGDVGRASEWAAHYEPETAPNRPQLTAYDYDRFALVQTLMAQAHWEAAGTAVAQLLRDAEATQHGRFVIWALVLHALILQASGDTDAASTCIRRALALAEPDGYVRVFVNQGAPMRLQIVDSAALWALQIASAKRKDAQPSLAYIDQLLAAFPSSETIPQSPISDRQSPISDPQSTIYNLQSAMPVEPLTERELAVLRLLASGHDNAEIAYTLAVAVSTVKSHINHIFGKLGVHTRLAALLRAQEQNLL